MAVKKTVCTNISELAHAEMKRRAAERSKGAKSKGELVHISTIMREVLEREFVSPSIVPEPPSVVERVMTHPLHD